MSGHCCTEDKEEYEAFKTNVRITFTRIKFPLIANPMHDLL